MKSQTDLEPWRLRTLRTIKSMKWSGLERDGHEAVGEIALRYENYPMLRECRNCAKDCKQTTAPRLKFVCYDRAYKRVSG